MITNYKEFLVEKLILSLNESVVVYSDKFASMLKRIDSPIAEELLRLRGFDYEVVSNYFDVDTKETISFISDKKAQELDEAEDEWASVKNPELFLRPNVEILDKFKSIGVEKVNPDFKPEEGKVGKIVLKYSDEWGHRTTILHFGGDNYFVTFQYNCEPVKAQWIKNRQPIRIGRGIRALLSSLGKNFSDEEIEKFVNNWKSEFDWVNNAFRNFELVSGDDIAFWYSNQNYEKGNKPIGALGQSCMAAKPDYYFQIYTKNPDVCSLLILKSELVENTICARALVWKLVSGEYFMDRVYYYDDSDKNLFRKYAQSKGWTCKKNDDSNAQGAVVNASGEIKYPIMQVNIQKLDYKAYPYVDTLKYLNEFRDIMVLSNDDTSEYILESVSGSRLDAVCRVCGGDGEVDCPDCDGDGEGKQECGRCDGNGKEGCSDCDGSGEITGDDGEKESCDNCGGDGEHDCSRCDGDGEYDSECANCGGRGRVDCPECG